jgi:hypothetical protein
MTMAKSSPSADNDAERQLPIEPRVDVFNLNKDGTLDATTKVGPVPQVSSRSGGCSRCCIIALVICIVVVVVPAIVVAIWLWQAATSPLGSITLVSSGNDVPRTSPYASPSYNQPSSYGNDDDFPTYYGGKGQFTPTELTTDLVAFINAITLSGRVIADPGPLLNGMDLDYSLPVEELALQWLLYSDPLELVPDTAVNQFRLQQRYALITLLGREYTESALPLDECDWEIVTCGQLDFGDDVGIQFAVVDILQTYGDGIVFLSEEVGLLSSVTRISLDGYQPVSIPFSIGKLTNMHLFEAANATGSIPESLGQLTLLEFFGAGGSLTGTLPESLGRLTSMSSFLVGGNQLRGTIPDSLKGWSNLEYINLASNKFTGSLPESPGQWPSMKYFEVAYNMLTGTIPSFVGVWPLAERAEFHQNNFTGSIPSALCVADEVGDVTADCPNEVSCECCTCFGFIG